MRAACYLPVRLIDLASGWLVVSRHYRGLNVRAPSREQALAQAATLLLDGVRELLSLRRLPPGLGDVLCPGETAIHLPLVLAAKIALMEGLHAANASSNAQAASLLGIGEKHLRTLLDPRRPSKITNIEEQLAKLGVRLTLGFEVAKR
jgi:hypothetical protein|eukprot:gene12208-biopygen10295